MFPNLSWCFVEMWSVLPTSVKHRMHWKHFQPVSWILDFLIVETVLCLVHTVVTVTLESWSRDELYTHLILKDSCRFSSWCICQNWSYCGLIKLGHILEFHQLWHSRLVPILRLEICPMPKYPILVFFTRSLKFYHNKTKSKNQNQTTDILKACFKWLPQYTETLEPHTLCMPQC